MPVWLIAACEAVISATPTACAAVEAAQSPRPSFGTSATRANRYVPTLIAARTVTRPARLNQAVAQPQPRPPRIDAQWYRPPAVGKAEATWPIVAATASEKRQA